MKINDRINALLSKWVANRLRKIRKQLDRESRERIQVTEFFGKYYISIDKEPVISLDDLTEKSLKVLEESRKTWCKHRLYQMDMLSKQNNQQLTTNENN